MKHTNHKTTIKVITQMARVIRKLSRDSTEYAHVYTETYTAITPYNHQNSIEAAHTYSPFTCGSNNNTQITTIKPHTKGYKQAATFPQAQPNNLTRTNISYVERMRSLQYHHAKRNNPTGFPLTLTAITYSAIATSYTATVHRPNKSTRNNLLAFKIQDTKHQNITPLYQPKLPIARDYSSLPVGNLA